MNKTSKISSLTFKDGQWSCLIWGKMPFFIPITNETVGAIIRGLGAQGVRISGASLNLDRDGLTIYFPATELDLPD